MGEINSGSSQLVKQRQKISKLEADLRKQKNFLHVTETNGNIGGWQFDPATLTQTWTDEIFRILEMDLTDGAPEVPKGLDFIDSRFRKMAEKAIQRAMEYGEPYNQEWIVTTARGNKKWVNAVCKPIKENGKVTSVSGSFQDISSQKIVEIELQESEERLRRVLDNSPFPTAVVDENDQIIKYWSKSAIELFGHNPKTTEEWYELAYPDPEYCQEVIERWGPYVDIARKSDKPISAGEYNIKCKNGKVKICEIYVQSIPGNLIVTLNDITEKKLSEEALKALNQQLQASEQQLRASNQQLSANEQQLRAINQQLIASEKELISAKEQAERNEKYYHRIINEMGDPVFVKDEQSRLILVNDAFCKLFDLQRSVILGKTLAEDVAPEERESFLRIDNEVLRTGKESIIEEQLTIRGGQTRTISTRKSRFKDFNGKKLLVGIIRDITYRREQERISNLKSSISQIIHYKEEDELYAGVLDQLLDFFESKHGVFGYIDREGALVCPSMTKSIWSECNVTEKSFVFPEDTWGDSIWGNGLRNKTGAYSNKSFKVPEGHLPVKRFLTMPLVFQDISVGMISVGNRERDYTDDDLLVLQEIADYLAPIIAVQQQRKHILKSLSENEAMLKAAMENSQAGIAIAEVPSGKLTYVNKAGLLIRDKDYEEVVKNIDVNSYVASWQILHFDGTPYKTDEVPLTRAVLHGESSSKEFIIRRDNNEDRYVWANAAPVKNDKGKQIAAIVVFLDITEQKYNEQALEQSLNSIRMLTRHNEEIREKERHQIARDLHDDLGQILTGAKIEIGLINNRSSDDKDKVKKRLETTQSYIDQAFKSIQRITAGLRPPVLDNLGLLEALALLLSQVRQSNEVDIVCEMPEQEPEIHMDYRIVIYRIVQEAITNVLRHARATRIKLSIREEDTLIHIQLQDNGVGIRPESIESPTSYGIMGMRERVDALSGIFEITSPPDGGTSVNISFPTSQSIPVS